MIFFCTDMYRGEETTRGKNVHHTFFKEQKFVFQIFRNVEKTTFFTSPK